MFTTLTKFTTLQRLAVFICLIGSATFAQAETWTGGNTGHPEWNLTLNWSGLTVPSSGAPLTFPVAGAQKNNTNNITAGTVFGPIVIDGTGYSLGGNSINLQGGLSLTGTNASATVSLPLMVNATQLITVQELTSTLTVSGIMSGSGGITKDGLGKLVITQNPTNTGEFRVDRGTLEVRSIMPNSIQLGNGYLSGTGTVGGIQSLLTPQAAISPGNGGATAIGTLTSTGNVELSSTDAVILNLGTNETDKLVVQGTCNFGGANFIINHLGTLPGALTGLNLNTDYVIVDNDGTDIVQLGAVMGTWLIQDLPLIETVAYQLCRVGGSNNNDLTIRRVPTTGTSIVLSPTTATNVGVSVTLRATVSSLTGIPVGNVSFYDGFSKIGDATINVATGFADLVTSALLPGTRQLTAVYDGSTSRARSQSALVTHTVIGTNTTTVLTVTPVGATATLTAQVTATAGTAAGSVDFFNGANSLGTVTLNGSASAQLTTSVLVAGAYTFKAVYQTATPFNGSEDTEVYTMTGTTTSTVVTSSINPASAGAAITFMAVVTGSTPTGTVTFYDGAAALGTGTVAAGSATFTTSALGAGAHVIKATYNGSPTHQSSISPTLTQTMTAVAGSGGTGGSGTNSGGGGCGLGSGLAAMFMSLFLLLRLRLRSA